MRWSNMIAGRVIDLGRHSKCSTRGHPKVLHLSDEKSNEYFSDDELIVMRDGRLDFNALQSRLAGQTRDTLSMAPFDVPKLEGAAD